MYSVNPPLVSRRYPVCLFVCLSFAGLKTHIHTKHITHLQPLEWTGGRRKLERGRAWFVLFSSYVMAWRVIGRARVCSFSNLYRILLFPFPFAAVSVFLSFFFFQKNPAMSDLLCFSVRCCVTTYAHLFLLLLIALTKKPPALS